MDPDIQEYFDFKYVEGELHIYIRQELVKALGWTDKDLEKPWLQHERVYPKVGNLHVFDANAKHYVCPHTCHDHNRVVVSGNLKRKPDEPIINNPFV